MRKIILFIFIFLNNPEYSYSDDEYFRTLRNDKVYLRQGPSFEYPIKIIYKKKFLPVLIQDSSNNFRKYFLGKSMGSPEVYFLLKDILASSQIHGMQSSSISRASLKNLTLFL